MFVDDAWKALLENLRGTRYWARIEPIANFLTFYIAVLVGTYAYMRWTTQAEPGLRLFFSSHLFHGVTIASACFGLLVALATRPPSGDGAKRSVMERIGGPWRATLAVLSVAASAAAIVAIAPHRLANVSIRFLDEPESAVDKGVFAYVVYELNRAQNDWYFVLDFDTVNEDELTSADRVRCEGDPLCVARVVSKDGPFVGITSRPLREASFWQNFGTTSVITTAEWDPAGVPSVYEYLVHALIVQGMVLHLEDQCGGLPRGSFTPGREAHGGVFQYSPRRQAMRAEVLASRLSPDERLLLMNCFGVRYMSSSDRLVDLGWMRESRVRENLARAYGVDIGQARAPR